MSYENLCVLYLNSASATSKDLNRSEAIFSMSPPIVLPTKSSIVVACASFEYTNFFINISATLANNTFTIQDNANTYAIVIADGSYSVSELSTAINFGVINFGLADGLITLIPNYSTNKVEFSISAAGYRLSFPAGSPYVILGCTLNQFIPAEVVPGTPVYTAGAFIESAPNVATFNNVQNVYLHTSLTNNSVFSGGQSNIIASSAPTAPIGSIQAFNPAQFIYINAGELQGQTISSIQIYLTNQAGNRISLTDEFGASILIARVIETKLDLKSLTGDASKTRNFEPLA